MAFSYFLYKMAHYLHHHLVTLDVPASQTCPICLSVCADRDQLPTSERLRDFHSVRFVKLQRERGRERNILSDGDLITHTFTNQSDRQLNLTLWRSFLKWTVYHKQLALLRSGALSKRHVKTTVSGKMKKVSAWKHWLDHAVNFLIDHTFQRCT